MKVTIEIPNSVWAELLHHTGAKTKRDAVMTALRYCNRVYGLEKKAESKKPKRVIKKGMRSKLR